MNFLLFVKCGILFWRQQNTINNSREWLENITITRNFKIIAIYLDTMMQLHQRHWDGSGISYMGKRKSITKLFFSKSQWKTVGRAVTNRMHLQWLVTEFCTLNTVSNDRLQYYKANFTFSELCIMTHMREKDQQDAHIY